MEYLENNDISIEEWWNHCHVSHDRFYLTGSEGPAVWRRLRIEDKLAESQVVLNIGVGLGHCTHALADIVKVVHVLDISEYAVSRVRKVIEKAWKPVDLPLLPENAFDAAISNLVAQHMTDDALAIQLQAVIRSLKPTGVFAMQFAYALSPARNKTIQTLRSAKTGGICRSLSHMAFMVENAGGVIIWAERTNLFPEHQSGWYGIHIAKNRSIPGGVA